eukprot:2091892-Rhodomonas_salina.1
MKGVPASSVGVAKRNRSALVDITNALGSRPATRSDKVLALHAEYNGSKVIALTVVYRLVRRSRRMRDVSRGARKDGQLQLPVGMRWCSLQDYRTRSREFRSACPTDS